jgi:fatty-acyl-CoA synthase
MSHVRGELQPPLLEDTVGAVLDRAIARWPDTEALVSLEQGVHWTYAEFGQRVDALAAGLLALGLEPGDRVGIWAPNLVQWTLTQFATAKAGLIQVNINPAYRLSELEYTLNKVGVRALIACEKFKTSAYYEMLEALAPEIAARGKGRIRAAKLPQLEFAIRVDGVPRPGWLAFDDLLESGTLERHRARLRSVGATLDRGQAINIQFTSGTTGLPKGATLSHRNIVNNAYFVGLSMGLGAGDRLCIPVPLYHCFGMVMGNLACVVHGATMVYPSAGFDPLAVLKCVESERCTALHGVPTMFIAELEHPEFDRYDLSSLRGGIMAGSPCPVEIMKRVQTEMHIPEVTICYGMTETSPVSFQSLLDDTVERRCGTVGRIHPHVEAKVIDPGTGQIVSCGQPGELLTRGYLVMPGYWENEEATRDAIDSTRWMHTGDLATLDEQGYCKIVGRIKDMVIRGGENLYPREIEEFLYTHCAISDVQVIGVPDAKYGEELCAWVRLKEGASATGDELREWCKGQIATCKIPRYWKFVDAFPMTVTGKIQKFKMREIAVEELGLAGAAGIETA